MSPGPAFAASPLRRAGGPLVAWLGLAALYLAFSLVYTWPLARHLPDRLAHDAGDPLLNAWILWWNATTRPLTESWWNGLAFWPTTGTLAFSEHLLGFAWLTSPVIWLSGNPILAYNLAFLSCFVLAALAMHLLLWRMTGRHDAAFVGALAFAFAPMRAAHLSHLQVLATMWMPVALLGLHEYWRTTRPRWLLVFAAGWLLQALCNNYYAVFFSVLVALWLFWFGLERTAWRRFAAAVSVSLLASVCLLPLVTVYTRVHAANGLRRGLHEISLFSADLAAFVNAPPLLLVWGWLRNQILAERELFPGLTALVLIAAGAVVTWRARRAEAGTVARPSNRALRVACLVSGLVGGIVVLAALWLWSRGQESLVLGGVSLSTRHPEKPMMVGVALLALAAMPKLVALLRRRTTFGFYVAGWIVCAVLSLGPDVRLFDDPLLYRAPYALLFEFVPGFAGVRVPARFMMIAGLCASIAAALAFARLVPRGRRGGSIVMAVAAVAFLLEGAIRPMPMAALPAAAPALPRLPGVILELPMGDAFAEAAALYRTSQHRRHVVNGYSGHEPLFYQAVKEGLALRDAAVLTELQSLTPLTVVVDRTLDHDGTFRALVDGQRGSRLIGEQDPFSVFRLDRGTRSSPATPPAGSGHRVRGITAGREPTRAPALVDGNADTGWSSGGPQLATDEIVVELESRATIEAIELDQGPWPLDVPRALEVAVADEGREWRVVWEGTTAVQTMRAALADPRKVTLHLAFESSVGRSVRIRQTAAEVKAAWRFAELRVLGPAGAPPAGPAP